MKLKNVFWKTIIGELFIDILITLAFYCLIPSLLNYTPYSIEKYNFIKLYTGVSYFEQALFMFLPYMITEVIIQIIYLKDMIIYGNNTITDLPLETKNKLETRLLNTPLICYLIKLVFVPIIVSTTLLLISIPTIIIIKLTIILTLFFILNGSIIYTYIRNVFKSLLKESKNFYTLLGKKFSINKEIFFQFMSIICASLIFILLLAYSRIIEEKGDAIYYAINNKITEYFENTDINKENIDKNLNELKDVFNNDEYTYFCITPDKQTITLDNKTLPDFTENLYIDKMVQLNENRIYDISKESQGIIEVIDTENGEYIYGIFFSIIPFTSVKYFLYAILVLLTLNIVVILFYCRNMSKNISEVSKAVEKVASGHEVDFEKKIAVTSNDEIGELVIAFNKILGLEKENVETKERNQAIMVEQERLSSLGQLIGGIAHNLKTPIMSIAGVVEGLTDLIKEYDESIDDPSVNKEDHHEIAKDMQNWVDKVKPYLSYMTEVIDAVKGQAVSMNASTMTNFTIKEFITRTQLLMKNELKRRHCNLNLDITANEESAISGEISALIQVIDNMIINAMDAYGDTPGNVDIKVKEDDAKVYIDVKDYAGGIPQKVQDKLFKEMITSKGKNGTGLGLYMSFSTIKGKFKGDIRFETEEGKGTTFFIELPKYVG